MDGEVVVSVGKQERALILNAMADAVLELCDGSRSVGDIAAFIRETLAVPAGANVEADVAAVLDELERAGIVEVIE
ncbi:MAG TPA: PqqD family protein [Polyangiaceae bacterium]